MRVYYLSDHSMIYFYLLLSIQILLESLPVSSSGHLILLQTLFKKQDFLIFGQELAIVAPEKFWDHVFHVIHWPTAIILIIFFFPTWFWLLMNVRRTWYIILKLIGYTIIADAITSFFYVIFSYGIMPSMPLWAGFLITGVLLIVQHYFSQAKNQTLTIQKAIFLGCAQGLALIPGISRFAAVFAAARWLGFSYKKSFEITWMLLFPLIIASGAVGLYVLYKAHVLFSIITPTSVLVMIIAGIGGWALLASVYCLVMRNKFWIFGLYMFFLSLCTYFIVK